MDADSGIISQSAGLVAVPLTTLLSSRHTSSSSIAPQCPPTPTRGILRRRHHHQLYTKSRSSSPCKSVCFADDVEEHAADDWDRSAVSMACPTYRDIMELKQIQIDLLPDRRGLCGPEYSLAYDDSDDHNTYFNLHDDDDVDSGDRRRAPRKRILKTVPLELCPILPSTPATTPLNSRCTSPVSPLSPAGSKRSSPIASPLLSPIHSPPGDKPSFTSVGSPPSHKFTPLHQPSPRSKSLMNFLPCLPPSGDSSPAGSTPTSQPESPMPTPPMTPIMTLIDLDDKKDVDAAPASVIESTPSPKVSVPATPKEEPTSVRPSTPTRRSPILPMMLPQRVSSTPSPPPLNLLQAMSCSTANQVGAPFQVTFKARSQMGTV